MQCSFLHQLIIILLCLLKTIFFPSRNQRNVSCTRSLEVIYPNFPTGKLLESGYQQEKLKTIIEPPFFTLSPAPSLSSLTDKGLKVTSQQPSSALAPFCQHLLYQLAQKYTVFQVKPHQCQTKGSNHFSQPAKYFLIYS